MRLFDLIRLSLRMFKARTMRTFLTILGMSVGIAAIIFLVSFGYGLQRTLLQKITTSDSLVSLDVTASGAEGNTILDSAAIETMRTLPNVVDVIPVLELPGQGKFGNVTLDINTVSSTAGLLRNEGLKINVGRLFTKDEKSSIVITKAVAQVFDSAPEDMLGQTVSLTLFQSDASGKSQKSSTFALPDTYTIVGVVEGEENLVYLSLDSLGEFPLVSYTKLKVKCSSTDHDPVLERP